MKQRGFNVEVDLLMGMVRESLTAIITQAIAVIAIHLARL